MRQSFLENRIPPPIVLLLTILLIWIISKFDTSLDIAMEWRWGSAITFTVVGLILDVSSVLLFFKTKTTVNPLTPNSSKQLVIQGFFHYSRNPMYLGMLLISLGSVCYFASPISLIAVAGFIFYINRFQIIPEERAMQQLFGDAFTAYKKRVRRWV